MVCKPGSEIPIYKEFGNRNCSEQAECMKSARSGVIDLDYCHSGDQVQLSRRLVASLACLESHHRSQRKYRPKAIPYADLAPPLCNPTFTSESSFIARQASPSLPASLGRWLHRAAELSHRVANHWSGQQRLLVSKQCSCHLR